mmetsp:Transcript_43655/g.140187  ORF Transcript_43655/g.140187 Transcript_43655/m.140187 type:complete len:263 (-) Transcript_43655:334-1122(-)
MAHSFAAASAALAAAPATADVQKTEACHSRDEATRQPSRLISSSACIVARTFGERSAAARSALPAEGGSALTSASASVIVRRMASPIASSASRCARCSSRLVSISSTCAARRRRSFAAAAGRSDAATEERSAEQRRANGAASALPKRDTASAARVPAVAYGGATGRDHASTAGSEASRARSAGSTTFLMWMASSSSSFSLARSYSFCCTASCATASRCCWLASASSYLPAASSCARVPSRHLSTTAHGVHPLVGTRHFRDTS